MSKEHFICTVFLKKNVDNNYKLLMDFKKMPYFAAILSYTAIYLFFYLLKSTS